MKQWQENITKHLGLKVVEIKTTNPQREYLKPADVYVTTYHRIAGWVSHLHSGRLKSVTFDEVQELRSSDSEKYRAAKNIAKAVKFCLGLSATPVYNYGSEMWNIMDVISPGCLSAYDEFIREWCRGSERGKVANPKALGTFLRDRHLYLRRTRQEVGRDLPIENRIVHTVPYDQAEHDRIADLAAALALKAVSGSFVERGQAAREFDLMMRMATGVAKARFVAEYVKILLENGEKVLLVGWHRDVYESWMKHLANYKPVLYTGSESANQKQASKEAFVSGDSQVMLMSLRSGVGLDGLQGACRTVVFGELDWSPQVHDQVIGRLRRDGQDDQVTAIFLVSDGGSDPPMVDLLGLKAEQSAGINDPLAAAIERASDEGRIKAMAARYLEMRGKS